MLNGGLNELIYLSLHQREKVRIACLGFHSALASRNSIIDGVSACVHAREHAQLAIWVRETCFM